MRDREDIILDEEDFLDQNMEYKVYHVDEETEKNIVKPVKYVIKLEFIITQ